MSPTTAPGGTFTMAGGPTVSRMGYGAMQLAGPGVFGPPRDRDEAIAVLREAVALGITHIDTSDFYGPHVTNEIIREALYPYPEDLTIVTKVGAVRDEQGGWLPAQSPQQLRAAVQDNLRNLGLEAIDIVNMRNMGAPGGDGHGIAPGSIAEQFGTLAELQSEGLIRHLGVSTVNAEQIAEARGIAEIVCVQNHYNIAHRDDDAIVESLAADGIAYVPYFPLGGFSPLQSQALDAVSDRLACTPMAVALAWLLQRAPNILLIPGTSSVAHLRDNVATVELELPADAVAELDAIAG